MFLLEICGDNNRQVGQFPIHEPRFTLGRLVNPDNQDEDATRFLALYGDDARQVANLNDMTIVVKNLHADYPDVELQLSVEIDAQPDVDVDELVAFVQRVSGVDLDTLPDKQISLRLRQQQSAHLGIQ